MSATYGVQMTTNYEKFSMLISNRNTSRNHINNLKQSIKEHPEILEAQPILVNEKFQIIDGQHRFQAASELNLAIYYTIVNGIGIETARAMNVLQRRWDPIDFAKSYALTGNDNYAEYIKAREDFELPHNVTMSALSGGRKSGLNTIFKRGEFETIDLKQGREYLDQIKRIEAIVDIRMIAPFAYALLQIFQKPEFSFDRLFEMIEKHGDTMLKRYTQVSDYLHQLEDIYNVGKMNKTRLY